MKIMNILRYLLLFFCLIVHAVISSTSALAFSFYFGTVGALAKNEVHIGQTAVIMPLGRIILIRSSQSYCAVKFTKMWSENESSHSTIFVASGSDEYANYESYFQENDDNNKLLMKDWKINRGELSLPKLRGIFRLAFSFARNEISCGNMIVYWAGNGAICFNKSCRNHGDDGLEFAPTPWTNISQVNLSDTRIKWYKFDVDRERVNMAIDKIWD